MYETAKETLMYRTVLWTSLLFLEDKLFIYLTMLDLCHGMWDLQSLLSHVGSSSLTRAWARAPLHWKHRVPPLNQQRSPSFAFFFKVKNWIWKRILGISHVLRSDKQDNESSPQSSLEEIKECHSVIVMPKIYGKNKVLWTTGGYRVEGIEFHHQKGSHSYIWAMS